MIVHSDAFATLRLRGDSTLELLRFAVEVIGADKAAPVKKRHKTMLLNIC